MERVSWYHCRGQSFVLGEAKRFLRFEPCIINDPHHRAKRGLPGLVRLPCCASHRRLPFDLPDVTYNLRIVMLTEQGNARMDGAPG